MCKEYNGWSNYETWNVNLWIDNDEYSQDYFYRLARDIKSRSNYPISELADAIKDFIETDNPLAEAANVYSDLLQAAIDSADFHEIAEAMLDGIEEETEE